MAIPQERLEVVVDDDGAVSISAAEVARLGVRAGEHLQLVRSHNAAVRRKRKKVRGVLVGRFEPTALLTREDFDATHKSNIEAAERKYGATS